MLEIELKSKDLKEYICLDLNKDKNEPIYDEDLNKITELDLDRYDLVDDLTDITLEDIVFFNNLKKCYLTNFVFDDKNIKLLSKQKNLDFLQLNDCIFKNNEELSLGVKHLVIVDSKNIDLQKYNDQQELQKLHIVNCANTNINGISKFKNLSKVYLQNLYLDNINEMKSMNNLAYINLNGSSVKDDSFEKNNKDFIIEHDDINLIYQPEDN